MAGQSTAVTVVQIAMIAVIAAVFMMLAVLCIRTMAKRHGNLEKMKIQKVKLSHIKNYFTAPVIVGIVACVMYMIMLAIFRNSLEKYKAHVHRKLCTWALYF